MLSNFKAYQFSKEHYWICKELKLPLFLKEQLLRASSSVSLNLAEGSGKRTPADQRRFYSIAYGSFRECEAILDLEKIQNPKLKSIQRHLGAILFTLSRKSTTNIGPSTTETKTKTTANANANANANAED